MGFTPLHGQLTVTILRESGFSAAAAHLAAEANEAVDAMENQGNAAGLANLHAMRGFLDTTEFVNDLSRRARAEDWQRLQAFSS